MGPMTMRFLSVTPLIATGEKRRSKGWSRPLRRPCASRSSRRNQEPYSSVSRRTVSVPSRCILSRTSTAAYVTAQPVTRSAARRGLDSRLPATTAVPDLCYRRAVRRDTEGGLMKGRTILAAAALCVLFCAAPSTAATASSPAPTAPTRAAWTFAVYANADNDLEYSWQQFTLRALRALPANADGERCRHGRLERHQERRPAPAVLRSEREGRGELARQGLRLGSDLRVVPQAGREPLPLRPSRPSTSAITATAGATSPATSRRTTRSPCRSSTTPCIGPPCPSTSSASTPATWPTSRPSTSWVRRASSATWSAPRRRSTRTASPYGDALRPLMTRRRAARPGRSPATW